MRRGHRSAVAAVAGACLLLSGCRATDAVLAEDSWTLTATFEDALNLPDGAAVKLGGVPVGEVSAITADGYLARVEMTIDDGVELPVGTGFRLRYTTALGEVFVEAQPPRAADGTRIGTGRWLTDGADLGLDQTTGAATVEDTLASASLLVNGGGLGQVQVIVDELDDAVDGRARRVRGLLRELDAFLGEALRSTGEIDRTLTALAAASATLDDRQRTINRALRELRPAARTLTENTDDLALLLRRTDELARTSNRLVLRTRDDLRQVVVQLGPVLEALNTLDDEVAPGLEAANRLARRLDRAVPNDYLNLYFLLHLESALAARPGEDGDADGDDGDGGDGGPGLPELPRVPGLPGLPGLPIPGVGR